MVIRYLSQRSLEEAVSIITSEFPDPKMSETVPVFESVGRVTAVPVFAPYSVPEVNLAAMDGIAMRSGDTAGASEQHPVIINDFLRLNTGNVVPTEFDSLVLIEDIWEKDGTCIVRKSARPWQNVRPAGEDIRSGELILQAGHTIRAFDTGALGTYGITDPLVRMVRVGLIPTGSELVMPGTRPKPGQVVESNTGMAYAWFAEHGARPKRYPITPDVPEKIREAIIKGISENDMLVVSAGSSAGTRDFTAGVIKELGELLFHGVAIKPGKPVILGKIDNKPIIGLPGYPLAAQAVLRELVAPLLNAWGFPSPEIKTMKVRLAQSLTSDVGFDEFVLLTVGRFEDHYLGSQQSRGAGVQMAPVRANAYVHIPPQLEGIDEGTEVSVVLTGDSSTIDSSLFITGWNDPALGHLANIVKKDGVKLHIANEGNMGGILALRKNVCHAAPMHMLSQDGEYNIPELITYLPEEELILVTIAEIQQGIVSKDSMNPVTLKDLTEVTFINRQLGADSRTLFDLALKDSGIDPVTIKGYTHEVNSDLAVAEAVKTGTADAGICNYLTSVQYGLEFVPIAKERYELVFRKSMLSNPLMSALVDAISSPIFAEALEARGGYDLTLTGTVRTLP
ncbi:MAG: molybdopterin biosynthesis protein [Methanogenium sp.]